MTASSLTIDLTNQEFRNIWKLINFTHQSLFMTGKAGTGKSTFLKYITANTKKRYVVLAPTGIAAVNVGGVTIHSFFKLPFKPLLPDDPDFDVRRLRKRMKYTKAHAKLIKELELIVIDEVSMVRADIIDFIDKVLRVYSGNMREPFGGKQMLFVGDIFQLEPVVTSDMRQLLRRSYKEFYFFSANVFKDFAIVPIELKKIYRQQDEKFISMLDRFRTGTPLQADVDALNSRVVAADMRSTDDFVMTLATRRDMVDQINESHLQRLPSKEVTYVGTICDDFPENSLPTSKELTLKTGAQVVFVRNDREKRWVNGTIGKISQAADDLLEVELENGERHIVDPEVWENIVYKYDEGTKRVIEKIIGTFTQYPIRLAWALTVHKSQGLTFKNVVIDVGRGAFSGGQTYVALSRCTSLEGISMRSSINQRDVFVSPAIIEFSRRFNNLDLIGEALENATADDAYSRASDAFERCDYGEAVDAFAEAVTARNELSRASVCRLIRIKMARISRLEEKIESLSVKIAADRERFRALSSEYVSMGRECIEEYGDLTAGLANIDKALSISPDFVDGWYYKGVALEHSGNMGAATAAWRSALKLDSGHLLSALALAKAYIDGKDYHEALNMLLAIADKHKSEPIVHNRLAALYDKIGDEESAVYHRSLARKLTGKKGRK